MGKIKKILENELVGGSQTTDIYPVTSIKAVYDESNERLDNIIRRKGIVNISTNYNNDHIAEVFTLVTAIAKVPSEDRVLGFQGKYLAFDGWHTIIYIGDSLTNWEDTTKWIDLADKVFNSISKNATFAGIATPSTNPGTPDGPVFWITSEPGVYVNFGNTKIDSTGIFTWDGTSWSFEKLNIDAYTKAESDARYLRGEWELINEVSEYDTSKNTITVAENCDGYKELAVRRINSNNINNTNVYLQIGKVDVSLQTLSSNTKDAVWHVVQDGNNLSVKFLYYNFVNTGRRLHYALSTNEYCINYKIGGKVELNFYNLTTLHDGENIKVYGKR